MAASGLTLQGRSSSKQYQRGDLRQPRAAAQGAERGQGIHHDAVSWWVQWIWAGQAFLRRVSRIWRPSPVSTMLSSGRGMEEFHEHERCGAASLATRDAPR